MGLSDEDIARAQADLRAGDRRNLPGLVRVSFGMYNTTEEVDALVDALGVIVRGEYRGQYEQDRATGDFRPPDWAPDLSRYFSLRAGERSGATC